MRLDYVDNNQTASWTQTNNITDAPADTVTGFNLISSNETWNNFHGLSNQGGVGAYFNGKAGSNWWYAVASSSIYAGVGTP